MPHSPIDIPTALTSRETAALVHLARGRRVAEAGSLLGYSTVAMARVAREVVAIDPHDGYPDVAPRRTLEQFRMNLTSHGVAGRVTVLVGEAQREFPKLVPFDLAFLDLTGDFGVTADCLDAALKMAALVAVHDYGRGGCQGATDAVDLAVRRLGLNVTRRDTLVVLEAR